MKDQEKSIRECKDIELKEHKEKRDSLTEKWAKSTVNERQNIYCALNEYCEWIENKIISKLRENLNYWCDKYQDQRNDVAELILDKMDLQEQLDSQQSKEPLPIVEITEELPIGFDTPWNTKDVLEKLIWATEYLLDEKDYDGHGHEEVRICANRGKEILSQMKLKWRDYLEVINKQKEEIAQLKSHAQQVIAKRKEEKEERAIGFWAWLETIGWDYDHQDYPSRWSNKEGVVKTEDELYLEYKQQINP